MKHFIHDFNRMNMEETQSKFDYGRVNESLVRVHRDQYIGKKPTRSAAALESKSGR